MICKFKNLQHLKFLKNQGINEYISSTKHSIFSITYRLEIHQLLLQCHNFRSKGRHLFGSFVLIGYHLVFDVPCSVCILQSIKCFNKVSVWWGYTGNHQCPATKNNTFIKHMIKQIELISRFRVNSDAKVICKELLRNAIQTYQHIDVWKVFLDFVSSNISMTAFVNLFNKRSLLYW